MRRHLDLLLLLTALGGCPKADTASPQPVPDAGRRAQLLSVGPRMLSNQTSQPLSVVGSGLEAGMALQFGPPISSSLPLVVLDGRHAFARLPGGLPLGQAPELVIDVTIPGAEGKVGLRLINDTAFPDLTALVRSRDGSLLFALSGTTDTVFEIELATRRVTPLAVEDGPAAIATWVDGEGTEWLAVVHQFAGSLLLINMKDPAVRRTISAPANAAGLLISQGRAYVAEQARDSIVAIELAPGRELWRTPVAPNPRELILAGQSLLVGSMSTGALELLDPATGATQSSLEPVPGTPIVGGGTAKYSASVMNGKAPRSLAWSSRLSTAFVASIGPNIGPNVDQMEVSMNGGVGAVDLAKGWRRHLGFGAGVTEALALDDARGLLYASDVGLGLVRVIDAKKLASGDGPAARALIQEIALRPPAAFPSIRPLEDFNVKGRAGPSLHAGPGR